MILNSIKKNQYKGIWEYIFMELLYDISWYRGKKDCFSFIETAL